MILDDVDNVSLLLAISSIFKERVQEMLSDEPLMRRLSSLPEAGFAKYQNFPEISITVKHLVRQ